MRQNSYLNVRSGKRFILAISALFFMTSKASFAGQPATPSKSNKNALFNTKVKNPSQYDYQPYLQVGGTRFFNAAESDWAKSLDFFVPLWQSPSDLVFGDVRLYDRSGKPFEGNIHLGYRFLSPEQQHLYGIYGAFDRKRTSLGNYFNQLMFGAECWLDKVFIGGNFYQSIGSSSKFVGVVKDHDDVHHNQDSSVGYTQDRKYEKTLGGGDAEVGYEMLPGVVGYVGGYYFKAKDTNTVCGPKARLTYDWSLESGKRVLGIFDKVGLEVGIQKDKLRGTTGYVSANLKIGLLPDKNTKLQGVARHMVDLVRRDVDIIALEATKPETVLVKENGKVVKYKKHNGSACQKDGQGCGSEPVTVGEDENFIYKEFSGDQFVVTTALGQRLAVMGSGGSVEAVNGAAAEAQANAEQDKKAGKEGTGVVISRATEEENAPGVPPDAGQTEGTKEEAPTPETEGIPSNNASSSVSNLTIDNTSLTEENPATWSYWSWGKQSVGDLLIQGKEFVVKQQGKVATALGIGGAGLIVAEVGVGAAAITGVVCAFKNRHQIIPGITWVFNKLLGRQGDPGAAAVVLPEDVHGGPRPPTLPPRGGYQPGFPSKEGYEEVTTVASSSLAVAAGVVAKIVGAMTAAPDPQAAPQPVVNSTALQAAAAADTVQQSTEEPAAAAAAVDQSTSKAVAKEKPKSKNQRKKDRAKRAEQERKDAEEAARRGIPQQETPVVNKIDADPQDVEELVAIAAAAKLKEEAVAKAEELKKKTADAEEAERRVAAGIAELNRKTAEAEEAARVDAEKAKVVAEEVTRITKEAEDLARKEEEAKAGQKAADEALRRIVEANIAAEEAVRRDEEAEATGVAADRADLDHNAQPVAAAAAATDQQASDLSASFAGVEALTKMLNDGATIPQEAQDKVRVLTDRLYGIVVDLDQYEDEHRGQIDPQVIKERVAAIRATMGEIRRLYPEIGRGELDGAIHQGVNLGIVSMMGANLLETYVAPGATTAPAAIAEAPPQLREQAAVPAAARDGISTHTLLDAIKRLKSAGRDKKTDTVKKEKVEVKKNESAVVTSLEGKPLEDSWSLALDAKKKTSEEGATKPISLVQRAKGWFGSAFGEIVGLPAQTGEGRAAEERERIQQLREADEAAAAAAAPTAPQQPSKPLAAAPGEAGIPTPPPPPPAARNMVRQQTPQGTGRSMAEQRGVEFPSEVTEAPQAAEPTTLAAQLKARKEGLRKAPSQNATEAPQAVSEDLFTIVKRAAEQQEKK